MSIVGRGEADKPMDELNIYARGSIKRSRSWFFSSQLSVLHKTE